MQHQIDAGLHWCERCDEPGFQRFCGQCGRRFLGGDRKWRLCPNETCHATAATDFCPLCGTEIVCAFLEQLEAGTVDIVAENALASDLVARLHQARPDLCGPGMGGDTVSRSLTAAVNAGFGAGADG